MTALEEEIITGEERRSHIIPLKNKRNNLEISLSVYQLMFCENLYGVMFFLVKGFK